ncbi:hypothetical protein [Sedimentitalea nanhaiensis]|uniref:Uncharacterized protein n=2 Tax=Sedimentitalea nanhaiensis TaxID=999627 RepID=A0A1I7EDM4_9RHOB|nr:hypothetical protein [Sedimentitalea nanhaiensis]SFU22048.1 hypothetical protein SAMN05216236_1831 [Sedimentitalea nanhaiensis]
MATRPDFRKNPKDASREMDGWLGRTHHGYRDLNQSIKAALMYFTVAWSIFEYKALGTHASLDTIEKFVSTKALNGTSLGDFEEAHEYFRNRYITGGKANASFSHLVGKDTEVATRIQDVLLGHTSEPSDKLIALLLIVYRLRNNMLHGVKWKWGVDDQHENFEHATSIIMTTLDIFLPDETTN